MLWNLLSTLLALVALPIYALHPKLRGDLARRLGRYPRAFAPEKTSTVWLHAASAGDVRAIAPVGRALQGQDPTLRIVLSTVTNSGQALARRRVPWALTVAPMDAPFAVRGALRALRPDVLVLEYAELWPVLIREARRAGVRIVLSDGRLSPSRVRGYRRLFRFTGNLLRHFDWVLMRDDAERERAVALGADPARVRATGNTKWDAVQPAGEAEHAEARRQWRQRLGIDADAPLWVAGSVHGGTEQEAIVEAAAELHRSTGARVLIAPRYVERSESWLSALRTAGLRASRVGEGVLWDATVLDTTGELAEAYHAGDVSFVGGSLIDHGGHDPLEPAAARSPLLMGPTRRNCAEAWALLSEAGAARPVNDAGELIRALRETFEDLPKARDAGARGARALADAGGAAKRNAALIAELLPTSRPDVE